jgi:UbiD family decarboxylase
MSVNDIREFINSLEKEGELLRIKTPVDPKFEVGAINRLAILQRGPALLFENVEGAPAPVATFLFGSQRRINMAFGTENREQTIKKYLNSLEGERPEPVVVGSGPCKENIIRDPDLTRDIPNITWGELDGGPYITLPLVVTKDLTKENRNIGIYRVMIQGPKEAGIFIDRHQHIGLMYTEYERHNEPMETAIFLGGDPLLCFLGAAPLKYGDDEFSLLSSLRGEPVPLVKCETVELEVPATAEVVIEGVVLPKVRRPEGPFGEYTGYYGTRGERPFFQVTCITHRNNYIWPGAYETKPTPATEDTALRSVTADVGILNQARKIIPEIKNLHIFLSSAVSYVGVVQIGKKPYAQFAKQVMDAVWASHKGCWIKILIVVDEDIDIYSVDDVIWAIATRVQPQTDMFIIDGHIGSPFDPSANVPGVSSHLGIDATVKIPERFTEYPPLSIPSESLMVKVKEKFGKEDFWRRLVKDEV